jgi:LacI family transcriptional regulator
MTAKTVTINDIAKQAGVSYQTVSRVLNNRPDVSEETRQRIWLIIDSVGYRPNAAAQSLRTNKSFTLGLLLNDITNSFYSNIVQGIEEEAIAHGYSLILCNTNEDPERELHYLRILQSKQVDGIILGPTKWNCDFIVEMSSQIPIILIDRHIPDSNIGAVIVDNETGAYEATQYLLSKGHREIGLATWQQDILPMQQRYAGYERAFTEAGLPINPENIIHIPKMTSEATAETIEKFLPDHPNVTAIFALNNQLGLGVLSSIHKMKLNTPEDIALVIFDDLSIFSLYTPAISVVRQPEAEIGKQAMRNLLHQINQPETYSPAIVVLATELIIRDSV